MEPFTDQVLRTKLERPRIPHGLVLRERLFDRLNQGMHGPLTLVCAGAGYGKTTLVSSWIESLAAKGNSVGSWPVAWLSLDEMDNSLQRFLQYLIAGVRTIFRGACANTLELLQARQNPPLVEIVTTFGNEITQLGREFVVVLDDHQSLNDATVSDFLSQLIRHWPASMHLVIISRRDPVLPLASLRAKGLLTEIRTRDLRFTALEATAYLNLVLPAPLEPSAGELLEHNIEGWVAGLQLASLRLRYAGNPTAWLTGLSGTEADFADYLLDEVVAHQPAQIQVFLLETAFLEHFCASLCKAVTTEADPDWTMEQCIDWLERANLFIVPLDGRQEWYRYHHIFRKVLQEQAMSRLGPERVAAVQRKSAAWYDENGMTDEALRYALAVRDFEIAARVIGHGLQDVLNNEDRPTLDRWLRTLPEDMIQQRAGLLIIKAWSLHFAWQLDDVTKTLRHLSSLLDEADEATLPLDEMRIVRGQMVELCGQEAYYANQFARCVDYCGEAMALLPDRWTYARSGTILYLGLALQASGKDWEAEQLFVERYQALSDKTSTYGLRLLTGLCHMYSLQAADLERSRQTARQLAEGAEVSGLGVMRGWGQYFLGMAHFQCNELVQAREHFLKLIEYRYTAHLGALRDGAICLAYIFQSLGQAAEAWQIADLLGQLDLDYGGRESEQTASVRACLRLMKGDLEGAARWADAFHEPVPDRAQLLTHSAHLNKARILLARSTPADIRAALNILDTFYDIAERGHNTRLKIEVLAMSSIALRLQGKRDGWKDALRTAVNLARPGGWVRLFVNLGTQMREALRELASQADARGGGANPSGETLRRILAAFPEGETGNAEDAETLVGPRLPLALSALPESLTGREVEILTLLSGPLSLKEIAYDLAITTGTVKSHALNIYGKLGVNKRRDAVARAQALGILSSN